jgi:hypothetical protein
MPPTLPGGKPNWASLRRILAWMMPTVRSVSNITGDELITVSTNPQGVKIKFEVANLLPKIPTLGFPVIVEKDGGAAGSEGVPATWTYTVRDIYGKTLATGATPIHPRYPAAYYFAGEDVDGVESTTYGHAFWDRTNLVVDQLPGEYMVYTICEIPWFWAKSWAVVAGEMGGGFLANTYATDSNYLVIKEVTGTPAMTFQFSFDDVLDTANTITLVGFYFGNIAHDKKIQLFNWNTMTFDNLTGDDDDFPSASSNETYVFSGWDPDDYVDPSGDLLMQIIHVSTGVATHRFNIDLLELSVT